MQCNTIIYTYLEIMFLEYTVFHVVSDHFQHAQHCDVRLARTRGRTDEQIIRLFQRRAFHGRLNQIEAFRARERLLLHLQTDNQSLISISINLFINYNYQMCA